MALINRKEYSFADIRLMVAGRLVEGFRGITYTASQEKEAWFGKGNLAQTIQTGNITYKGEIVLSQSEVIALRRLGGGSLLSLSINGTITFGNPALEQVMHVVHINGMEFTEDSTSFAQGDVAAEFTLPFLALEIREEI